MEENSTCKQLSKESWSINTISDKIDFKINTVTRDRKGHYILIKESISEDTTIVNKYVHNIGAPQKHKTTANSNKRRN